MTEQIKRGYGAGLQAIDFSDISGQIEKAKKRNKQLKIIGAILLMLSLIIGYLLYGYFVGRYAVIEDLVMTQDISNPRLIHFKFSVKEGGIVEKGYEKAIIEEIVRANSKPTFRWSWAVEPSKREFEVYVRSRSGVIPVREKRTFPIAIK